MNAPLAIGHPAPVKLTVDDYLLLDRSGALAPYGRTELVNGVIYLVSPQHSPHYMLKTRLLRRLADAVDSLGVGLETWVEGSIDFRPHSCPMPDIFVTRCIPQARLTEPEIVALVVEISSTTLAFDLGDKVALYAASGVPEYWVVDVEARCLHQMWAPGADGYAERRQVALGERVEAVTIGGLRVDTSDI